MRYYHRLILEFTNCTESEAHKVEEIMREEIFHSTLDWQTRNQLKRAALKAFAMLKEDQEAKP